MRMVQAGSLATLIIFSYAAPAFAAPGVPRIINNQGRLMDSSGTLLGGAGTEYCFRFSFYDDATVGSGTKLWPSGSPSTMTVTVRNGIYNVGIGDTGAGGDTLDYDFQTTDATYLNVEVASKVGATCAPGDGAETFENLAPRQRIFAAGYAINAGLLSGYGAAQEASGDQIPVLSMGKLVLGDIGAAIRATSTNALTLQGDDATGDIQFFGNGNRITSLGNLFLSGLASASSLFSTDQIAVGTTASTSLQGSPTGTSTIQGFLNVTGTSSVSTFSGGLRTDNLEITGTATTTSGGGFDIDSGCYAVGGVCLTTGVSSVDAGDTTLSVSPTGGDVVVALNLANANVWTGLQRFGNASSSAFESGRIYANTIQSTSTNPLSFLTNLASTAGLTFGSTSTPQMFAADTANYRVTIGTGGASPILFVLDTKNTAGDPSGVDGAQYYNSNTGQFRCYSGSVWRTCGGLAASSTGDVQFRNADGSFAATSNFNWSAANNGLSIMGNAGQTGDLFAIASSTGNAMFSISSAGVLELATTSEPATPPAGQLNIYAKNIAGRILPKWMGPAGIDTPFQPAFFSNNIAMWVPNTGTTVSINFGTPWTARNSGTNAAQSTPAITSTSLYTSMKRALFATGTTATGASGTQSAQQLVWRGSSAGLGGFFFFARVGVDSTYVNTVQLMTGVSAMNSALGGQPSAQNNSIVLGKDSGDTTWQIITRNGTTATKTDTGVTIASGQVMDFYIFAAPNDSKVTVRLVEQTTSGPNVIVDNLEITSTLPVNTTMMYAHHHIRSTAGTTAKGYALNRIYVETDI